MESHLRKLHFCPLIVTALLVLCPLTVFGGTVVFVEDFTSTAYKDEAGTSAWWDTAAGELKLYPFTISSLGGYDTPGVAGSIAVAGSYAFVADGANGIVVLNIADHANPTLAGSYDTPGNASAVAIAGNYAYVADASAGLVVLDITDPTVPALAGSYVTAGGALDVALDGDHAFVAASTMGLVVVNITNPALPTLAGSLATGGVAFGVAVDGDLVFVAAGSVGLVTVDVSDPATPALLGTFDSPGSASQLAVAGDLVWVADGSSGLIGVDVSDPSNPTLRSSHVTAGPASGVELEPGFAYVAIGGLGIEVVDVSSPELPVLLDSHDTAGAAISSVLIGKDLFVADGGAGLQVLEVKTLDDLSIWGTQAAATSARRGVVVGELLFLASGTAGLEILNIGDPLHPTPVGSVVTPGWATDVQVAGDFAFIADGGIGLTTVDVSDPTSPTLAGGYVAPGDFIRLVVEGDYAYLAASAAGLVVVNVLDPETPSLAGGYTPDAGVYDVAIDGDHAYLAVGADGLDIVSISDPTTPVSVSTFGFGTIDDIQHVAVVGDRALLAGSFGGNTGVIVVADVSNPASPAWPFGALASSALITDMKVQDNFAYVNFYDGLYYSGIDVFDITNLLNLTTFETPLISYSATHPVWGAVPAGDFLLACGAAGIEVAHMSQRSYLRQENVGQSLAIGSEVAAIKLTTTHTDSIKWEMIQGPFARQVTPGQWTSISSTMGADLSWRSTHVPIPGGGNPTCSRLEIEMIFNAATIDSIVDVPNDQGGWLRLNFTRSGKDLGTSLDYIIWRRVDTATAAGLPGVNTLDLRSKYPSLPWIKDQDRLLVDSSAGSSKALDGFPPGIWEIVGSFPGLMQPDYTYLAPTQADLSLAGPAYSVHVVTSHTGSEYWVSEPDSASSIDNIAPGVPESLFVQYGASGNQMSWDVSPDEDFQYFRVYRSTDPSFVPAPENLVHALAETSWSDNLPNPWAAHYKLTALDHAGNESDPSSPATTTDVSPDLPEIRFALHEATPNPFNPRTTITYSIPRAGHVELEIYDLAGRHVNTLVSERMAIGEHQVHWDGKDDAGTQVASGVYLYQLRAGDFVETKRVVLLK